MPNKLKILTLITCAFMLIKNVYGGTGITINQAIDDIKNRLTALEQMAPGPGIPNLPVVDSYTLTGTCTALTTQPTDACPSGSSVCYDTAAFVDTGSINLLGQTFTAIKTTADATDKDGGVWLCDSADLTNASVIAQCTSIGGNRRDGSKTIEFTIPVGAANKKIYVLSMNSLGVLSTISTMTAMSVCKKTTATITP